MIGLLHESDQQICYLLQELKEEKAKAAAEKEAAKKAATKTASKEKAQQ